MDKKYYVIPFVAYTAVRVPVIDNKKWDELSEEEQEELIELAFDKVNCYSAEWNMDESEIIGLE